MQGALAAGADQDSYVRLSREFAELDPIVATITALRKAEKERDDLRSDDERPGGGSRHGHARRSGAWRRSIPRSRSSSVSSRCSFCPRTPPTRRARSSKSAPALAERRPRCSRRSLPHVSALCRAHGLEGRDPVGERVGDRRLQGDHRQYHGQGRVRAAQIRVGRASRAARAGDRGAGAHPYLGGDGGGAARGRGGRHQDRRQGPPHRRVSRQRSGRAVGQHHRQRCPYHASPDRARRQPAGREVAAQEQGARR